MPAPRNLDPVDLNRLHIEENMSLREIAKIYNTSHNVIKKYLVKGGFDYKQRIYNLNENYFENLDSLEKLYFLGWIYSDGYVYNHQYNNDSGLCIKLQKLDEYILEYFRKLLEYDRPVKTWINNSGYKPGSEYAEIKIGSKKLFNDLCKYGLMERKTFKLRYPFEHIYDHRPFILGVFDGDGGIHIKPNKMASLTISGTKELLEGIRKIFEEELNVERVQIHKHNNIYQIAYGGVKPVMKIAEWLYSWNPPTYLTRKKDKIDTLLEMPKYGKNMVVFKCPECGNISDFEKRNIYQLKKYKFKAKFCSLSCSGKFNRKYQLNGNKLIPEMEQALKENIIREERSNFKKTVMNDQGDRIFDDID
ncbi:hypothetical protein ACFWMS_22145 [Peribacillus butanolivorans]|uniref:hypothetical protein n=1 Tax=Peribacillus butanolivorans TaxID=421767 RepID=UPI0036500253